MTFVLLLSIIFRHKPLFTSHERECTKDYKIPNTEFVIPKGNIVHVYFPKFSLSDDNFIKPHDFQPENFSPENFKNKFAFQGFGQGPRACPGELSYLSIFPSYLIPNMWKFSY